VSPAVVLTFYPLWAVSVVIGLTALHLGRERGRGMVALCFVLAFWVAAVVLFAIDATRAIGERAIPSGMLLAGAFVHAGGAPPRLVAASYGYGFLVGISGAIDPGLFYSSGLGSPGPLFWPTAIFSAGGTLATAVWLVRSRRPLLALAAAFGGIGGGGAVAARVLFGLGLEWSAAALLVAVALVVVATVRSERRMVLQAVGYAVMTALVSAIGLPIYFRLLPVLSPGPALGWLAVVTFFAALPLDALRGFLVDAAGRRLFAHPIGVRDLADEVRRNEARADHAERLAEIGALAGAVAHEIRNPLGVIAAQAKLLERRGADAESVAALRAEVERARRFLDDLLRYGRPRPLEPRSVVAGDALAAAVATVRAAIGPTMPEVALDADGAELVADPAGFHDVAVVLVSNAALALRDRPAPRLAVGARAEGGDLVVTVEDNGPGVPHEIEDRLFEPFVSGRGREGTGLGLAIAARWVERHGGRLRHERPAEGGARFVVTWPRRGPAHA